MLLRDPIGPSPRRMLDMVTCTFNLDPSNPALLASIGRAYDGYLPRSTVSSGLFGICTTLFFMTFWALCRRGLSLRSTRLLFAAATVLYASTTVFFVCAALRMRAAMRLATVVSALQQCTIDVGSVPYPTQLAREERGFNVPMTATLAINSVVNDGIVLWRAFTIWSFDRRLCTAGGTLLSVSFVAGVVSTVETARRITSSESDAPDVPILLGDAAGMVCILASRAVNLLAMAAVSRKAWRHWKTVRSCLTEMYGGFRALRSLMLLVESGIAYCLVWFLVVVYHGISLTIGVDSSHTTATYARGVSWIVDNCLVYLIAIYPFGLITVFALKGSVLDHVTALTRVTLKSDMSGAESTGTGSMVFASTKAEKIATLSCTDGSQNPVREYNAF
ncbi:uncharacterized protein BXZ73DRAFT_99913 [Epithele typhae]|uniref:uncharacterized protein n=1 Tax=Epithele typhae TaxID=378194 RepID=UPI002007EC0D|nr:uncharacterized protein BXZ73DRAFT_99913 [Epithele typhae]KAH9938855.1 hypothetical protein BXZ73DRAFT_99913 [Epithele typhae]